MAKRDKQKPTLARRLRSICDRAGGRSCRAELLGRERLVLQGAEDILDYEPCRILLAVRDPALSQVEILGRDLVCLSYHPDAVVVEGHIRALCLCSPDGEEAP